MLCLFLTPIAAQERSEPAETTTEAELVFGDEESPEEPEERPLNSFGVWDLIRMVLILALVVGLIYAVFYLLKRSSKGRIQSSQIIKILGSRSISGNKSLHLVEIGRQIFLVGSGDNGINLVSEINDKESIDEIRLSAVNSPEEGRRSFSDILAGMLGGRTDGLGTSASLGGDSGMNFFKRQKDRLKRLK
jgi:flagellar protein FliO/FliZ